MKGALDQLTVHVLANARDRALTCEFLQEAGLQASCCEQLSDLNALIADGTIGMAIVAEEAISASGVAGLSETLSVQPTWSDVPIVLFTTRRSLSSEWAQLLDVGSVTLLERPVNKGTMIAAVRSGLRARRRQYQMRDLLVGVEEANRRLAEQDRRKDEFLAMLGHELRNPLGVVTSALYILRTSTSPTALSRQRDAIERQVRRLARLVDDLLDVSRVTMGKIVLRPERVDLRDIAGRCVDEFGPLAREQGQTLTLTSSSERLPVQGDLVRLEQVLSNLVTNALKYTPEGGRIEVILEPAAGDAAAVLRVRDSGMGIEPEMLGRVFELFTQADRSLARARGGLGLGLPVVKHLVELHGGTVMATSAGLGQGSEFVVRLPLAAPAPHSAVAGSALPPRERPLRIVLVEDNADARDAMIEMLRLEGHHVDAAANGIEGAQLIVAKRPEVALVDLGLPGWDGLEVARYVREGVGAAVKLVALTGYGQPQDRLRVSSAGFDAHLVKPICAEDLFRAIANVAGAA
jgi:signal transduction histidine kinase